VDQYDQESPARRFGRLAQTIVLWRLRFPEKDLWELAVHPCRFKDRHAVKENKRAKPLLEDCPFERRQPQISDLVRQPARIARGAT